MGTLESYNVVVTLFKGYIFDGNISIIVGASYELYLSLIVAATTILNIFLEWNGFYFNSNLTEVCS